MDKLTNHHQKDNDEGGRWTTIRRRFYQSDHPPTAQYSEKLNSTELPFLLFNSTLYVDFKEKLLN